MNLDNQQATAKLAAALSMGGAAFTRVSCEFLDHQRALSVLVEFADRPSFEEKLWLKAAGQLDTSEVIALSMRAQRIRSPWAQPAQ